MPNDQKKSEGSSVAAEVGQASSGDSEGNSAVVDQVFSMFKDFLEKKLEDLDKENKTSECERHVSATPVPSSVYRWNYNEEQYIVEN